ncbi:MAG: DNA repair protein RecN [Verrucomicrobiaceae bacterium]|nr:DNA repair protein RecN [Verrucomicrobiaceae bacterium]
MLSFLKIRHLALVEDVTWELGDGLLAVTGETGAGKSIIVGALKLILGERADRSLIRSGEDACTVEARFQLKNTRLVDQILAESGVEPCQDGELLIKRSITISGANKQFVNCSPVTLNVLKNLGEQLVDLHGPHDHQSLNSQDRQLEMLDKYAGIEARASEYSSAWKAWREALSELHHLETSERASEQQMDMLRFQVTEISDANLKPDEEDELETRHRISANAARLTEICAQLMLRLGDGEQGLQAVLREVTRLANDLERIDPSTSALFDGLRSAQVELQELESSVQDYVDDIETDPSELDRLDKRLTVIQTLKRKYGSTIAEIIAYHDDAAQKLGRMENRGEELDKLKTIASAKRQIVDKTAAALSKERAKHAPKLAKEITAHLADLGFQRSVFDVRLVPHSEPARSGAEEVDFHFAPNPGEPQKPLRLTASSGEMSRVLLAVKSALARQDSVPLLVFDEIDANVGGNIAEAVGRKMSELGTTHQVIAITHFPQVASLASSHYVVTKEVEKDRTRSQIHSVEGEARIEELTRMLGGNPKSARIHAESLLAGTP